IQVWVDGIERLEVQNGFNATATRHGLEFTTSYTWYDNFVVRGSLPPTISQVIVSPAVSVLPFGATQALTARAVDAGGNTIPNVTFAWIRSHPEVMSVNAVNATTAGVTALAQGTSTIAATPTTGPVGTANITVDVGQVLVFDSFASSSASLTTHAPE